jgi:hypothetical protein
MKEQKVLIKNHHYRLYSVGQYSEISNNMINSSRRGRADKNGMEEERMKSDYICLSTILSKSQAKNRK